MRIMIPIPDKNVRRLILVQALRFTFFIGTVPAVGVVVVVLLLATRTI